MKNIFLVLAISLITNTLYSQSDIKVDFEEVYDWVFLLDSEQHFNQLACDGALVFSPQKDSLIIRAIIYEKNTEKEYYYAFTNIESTKQKKEYYDEWDHYKIKDDLNREWLFLIKKDNNMSRYYFELSRMNIGFTFSSNKF